MRSMVTLLRSSSDAAVATTSGVGRRIASAGAWSTLAAVTVQTTVHVLNAATADLSLLNANAEHSVFAWAAACLIFAVALAAALLALVDPARRRTLLLLTALVLFLSLDEAVAIHERIGERGARLLGLSGTWDSVVWPVVLVPVTAAVLILLLLVRRGAPHSAGRYILIGLGALGAAVAAEVVSAPLSPPGAAESVGHTLEGALEEGLELGGWGLIATALLSWFASALAEDPTAPARQEDQSSVK